MTSLEDTREKCYNTLRVVRCHVLRLCNIVLKINLIFRKLINISSWSEIEEVIAICKSLLTEAQLYFCVGVQQNRILGLSTSQSCLQCRSDHLSFSWHWPPSPSGAMGS